MTARIHSPRQRFMAHERRAPVVAKEVLGLPHFSVLRCCPKCEQWKTEDTDNFHHDDTAKSGWAASCKACRNKRDRDRYQEEKKGRRKPVGRDTQHLTAGWCPVCWETNACDHGVLVNRARATGPSVEAGETLPPNSVHLDIECDMGRGRKRYEVTLILGPSLYGKVEDGPIDIETGEPTGGFHDEIDSARFQIGSMWVEIPRTNTATLRQLHTYGVSVHRYLWGKP